jgi:putative SOS response-associated peptidase YedK
MCGRFTLYSSLQEIRDGLGIDRVDFQPCLSFNIAPTQEVAVVVREDGANVLEGMRWGLIPHWAKDTKIGSRMINARAETIAEKPAFKRLLTSQRCLVVADGFYEWRQEDGRKAPMYIRLKSKKPFGLAGLYDDWISESGERITSCTIVTTGPNELMAPIHNRMPVIIPYACELRWLDEAVQEPGEVLPLLVPYSAADMEAYPVSALVNSPRNNSPDIIAPEPV